MAGFPVIRMRRMRKNENLRSLIRETKLSIDDLICPLFFISGYDKKEEISSMPGQFTFLWKKFRK